MLHFYLGEKNSQHEINCSTNASFTEIAGEKNVCSIDLEWNDCKNAIFPNTLFLL